MNFQYHYLLFLIYCAIKYLSFAIVDCHYSDQKPASPFAHLKCPRKIQFGKMESPFLCLWERRVPTNNWYERTQVWMWVVISIPINLRIEFKEIPIQVLYPGSRQGPLQQWYVGWPGRATGSWLATRTTFSHPHISNTSTHHIHKYKHKHKYPNISNTNTQHIHKSNTNTPISQTQTHTQIKHKYPDISDTKHKNPHILNTNRQHKYIHLKYITFSVPAH